jgi:hypothetical protein
MSTTQIQVGPNGAGQTVSVNLVALPVTPGFRDITFDVNDTVATVRSPYTGVTQTQAWPGADWWSATVTLPPLTRAQAAQWTAMLMELRGMANAVMLSDPLCATSQGSPSGVPVANTAGGTGWNAAGTTALYTRGWTANRFRLLLPGDAIQVGYRLHRVLDQVNADVNGDAAINIWPSLREVPADGQAIILKNPAGLFRLAANKRTWNTQTSLLTSLSIQLVEYR